MVVLVPVYVISQYNIGAGSRHTIVWDLDLPDMIVRREAVEAIAASQIGCSFGKRTAAMTNEPNSEIPTRTILIVTSDVVQLRLTTGLLNMRGHESFPASNCKEALLALEERSFDVVLIDLSLDDSSIRELTARLHDYLGSQPRTIGIAIDGSQPLAYLLDDWVELPTTANALYSAVEQQWPPPSGVLELDLKKAARDIPGGIEMIVELAEVMLREAPRFVDMIDEGLSIGDHEQAERGAHSLKSGAQVFGATALYEIAAQLEKNAKHGRLEDAAPQFEQVKLSTQQLVEALRKVVA